MLISLFFFFFTSGKLSDLQLEGVLYAVSIIVNITYTLLISRTLSTICQLLYCSFFCPHKAFKIFGKDGFPAKNKFITKKALPAAGDTVTAKSVLMQSHGLE